METESRKAKPYLVINPTGTESHFASLAAAIEKARKNAWQDRDDYSVWKDNRHGTLVVDQLGDVRLSKEAAATVHAADWRHDAERAGIVLSDGLADD